MSRKFGTNKDIERLARAALRAGWSVKITRSNHLRFIPPVKNQPTITGSLTGSVTSVTKLKAQLAKAGVK